MQTRADRLTPLPENVLRIAAAQCSWNGLRVTVNETHGCGRVAHSLCHETETRLTALLEETGSPCEPRLRVERPCLIEFTPRHMHFAPAGLETWGYSADCRYVRDATLSFDLRLLDDGLDDRTGADLSRAGLTVPRLRFSDDRIWTLVRLLAEAVADPDPSMQLYGDGLTASLVALLAAPPRPSSRPAPAASPRGSCAGCASIWRRTCPNGLSLPISPRSSAFPSRISRALSRPRPAWRPIAGNSTPASAGLSACCSTPPRPSTRSRRPPVSPTPCISAGPSAGSPARPPRPGGATA